MKDYSNHTGASISMSSDEKFIKALDKLFGENNIEYVFESGTYTGLGSTTSLAKAIERSGKKVKQFITVEVNKTTHEQAVKNLAKYPFITPLWGLTVSFDEAKKFIREDEVINNHEKYPDIFIDGVQNPAKFYLKEIEGHLVSHSLPNRIAAFFTGKKNVHIEESLFEKHLAAIATNSPLILLDSAGGMGFLEFTRVLQLMKGNDFFLILDDIHHLKHFRSYRQLKEDKNFTILNDNYGQGWAIAKYHKVG